MSKYFLIWIFASVAANSYGQDTLYKPTRRDLGLTLGFVRQKENFISVGAIIGRNRGNIHQSNWAYGVASEFRSHKDNSIIGAKAFFDYDLIIIGARLNLISYFERSFTDVRLIPEIGFNFLGFFNIYYGYNFPIMGTEIIQISRSRLNIGFNLYKSAR